MHLAQLRAYLDVWTGMQLVSLDIYNMGSHAIFMPRTEGILLMTRTNCEWQTWHKYFSADDPTTALGYFTKVTAALPSKLIIAPCSHNCVFYTM